jgi:hypothetical protein
MALQLSNFNLNTNPVGLLAGLLNATKQQNLDLSNATLQQRLAMMPKIQQSILLKNLSSAGFNQARTNAIPSDIAYKNAQMSEIQPDVALKNAQTNLANVKSQFTPQTAEQQAKDIQNLKNQSQMQIAQMNRGKDDLFQKVQYQQIAKDLDQVSKDADNSQKQIPIFQNIHNSIDKAKYLGPSGEMINWTTPEGQNLGRNLANAQMGKFAQLHNIRNQREFNKALEQIGTQNQYASVLHNMVDENMKTNQTSIDKLKFYHDYLNKGGRDPQEAQLAWTNSQNNTLSNNNQQMKNFNSEKEALSSMPKGSIVIINGKKARLD